MMKKLFLAIGILIATMGFALAQVDVNKADQAALDGIKGIGPKVSKTILDERKKGGDFKDWADFEKRVKGVGSKSTSKLSEAGLTINGQPKAGAPAASASAEKKPAAAASAVAKDAKPASAKVTAPVVAATPVAPVTPATPATPAVPAKK